MSLPRPNCVIAALLIAACGVANADQTWLTDQNGCKVVEPEKHRGLIDKTSWDGACVDGYASGKGTLTIGITSFIGELKHGQILSGDRQEDDKKYSGEFKDNAPFGRGTWTYPDITVKGVFQDSKLIGPGEAQWADGSRYEGALDDNRYAQGKGRITYANGGHYEGDFLNNKLHGSGTYVSASGMTHTGGYAFGKYDGYGTMITEDGGRYEGEFKSGERQGKGRFTDPSGMILEGEWKASQLNGKCKIEQPGGTVYEGDCVSGQGNGKGRLQMAGDNSVYEGDFKSSQFHGQGRLTTPDLVYEGGFALGKFSGQGKQVLANGDQYEGEFARNQPHGKGIQRLATPDGSEVSYDGDWKDGAMEGQGTLKVGKMSFKGQFRQNDFMRGTIHTHDGRIIEADEEKQTYFEVLDNGTKLPVNPSAWATPEA